MWFPRSHWGSKRIIGQSGKSESTKYHGTGLEHRPTGKWSIKFITMHSFGDYLRKRNPFELIKTWAKSAHTCSVRFPCAFDWISKNARSFSCAFWLGGFPVIISKRLPTDSVFGFLAWKIFLPIILHWPITNGSFIRAKDWAGTLETDLFPFVPKGAGWSKANIKGERKFR